MFNNIGKKIKGLAKTLFWIEFVLFGLSALVGGIRVWNAIGCDDSEGVFAGLSIFLVGTGVGFLISWIGSFFMYGFGQLIDDSEINRKTNQQILAKLGGTPVPEEPAEQKPAAPFVPAAPAAPEQPVLSGWYCSNCGSRNDGESVFCFNCGTKRT